jgi:hypothetical protein
VRGNLVVTTTTQGNTVVHIKAKLWMIRELLKVMRVKNTIVRQAEYAEVMILCVHSLAPLTVLFSRLHFAPLIRNTTSPKVATLT